MTMILETERLTLREFTEDDLDDLVAIIHPEHGASRRVAEKIGMHSERRTMVEDYPAVVYAVDRR